VEYAKDIVADLLRYDEDTAGGIMHKELVKVNETCTYVRERKCAFRPKIFQSTLLFTW
jgi:Mg/Co/Ni transporter MgtE